MIIVLAVFEGNVDKFAEEFIVFDDVHILHGVKLFLLEMLLEAAGDGAGLGCQLRVKEVEAALERALKEAASVVANTCGHVVGRDVGRSATRCSQANGEAAGQVKKYFRHEVAGVAERIFTLCLCLLHQFVVGFLKQILKVDQMLKVSHG